MAAVTGIVLAAGAGTRAGGPKVLRTGWLDAAVGVLRVAGCDPVLVVLGAAAAEAAALVPGDAQIVVAEDWADGVSASLRAGLVSAPRESDAVLLTLVDLPDMPGAAATRVVGADVAPDSLRRAVYDGRPGHPTLLGRDHWSAIAESVSGDTGANTYLREHGAVAIECGDLWDGREAEAATSG